MEECDYSQFVISALVVFFLKECCWQAWAHCSQYFQDWAPTGTQRCM